MPFKCRIKKFLQIQSPSYNPYCKIGLNNNPEKCQKCKYFKPSIWNAKEVGQRLAEALSEGAKKASESMNKMAEAMNEAFKNMKI